MLLDEKILTERYTAIYNHCRAQYDLNDDVVIQSAEFQRGKWREYISLLDMIPIALNDKVIADFGCKYGHLFPLLEQLQVRRVVGIEAMSDLISTGRDIRSALKYDSPVDFALCEDGYISLQPESVDVIFVNEVLSHVNPRFLHTIYEEFARILTPGGIVFISDNNNLAYQGYFDNHLIPLYDAIENGPSGIQIEDVTIQACMKDQRKDIIKKRYPDMAENQVDFLAINTAGLYCEYFERVIDRYVQTGELIRRPYRRGIAPTYPGYDRRGMVEERGFHPEQFVFDLMQCGFEARILSMHSRSISIGQTGKRLSIEKSNIVPAAQHGMYAYGVSVYRPADFPIDDSGTIVVLLEDGKPLDYPETAHAEIGKKGMGRYSVWPDVNGHKYVYFSSSDNTDPRTNGHHYEIYWAKSEEGFVVSSPAIHIIAIRKD